MQLSVSLLNLFAELLHQIAVLLHFFAGRRAQLFITQEQRDFVVRILLAAFGFITLLLVAWLLLLNLFLHFGLHLLGLLQLGFSFLPVLFLVDYFFCLIVHFKPHFYAMLSHIGWRVYFSAIR